jgi:hypothetical protein
MQLHAEQRAGKDAVTGLLNQWLAAPLHISASDRLPKVAGRCRT